MRILMVNKFLYPNGGSEAYMLELGQALKNLGHDVQYYGMEDPQNTVGNDLDIYAPNVDYHKSGMNPAKLISTAFSTIYSQTAREQMETLIDRLRPDVVHMNNINFQLTPSIFYSAKDRGVPLVQTVHDSQIACPCHRLYIEHEQRICEECEEGKYLPCIRHKCVQDSTSKSVLAAAESYYYHARNTYNLVDAYICPSNFMADCIRRAGVDLSRIQVLTNFSARIDFPAALEPQDPYALYFGRLSVEKGLETLLDVAQELPEVRLIIAGRGPLEELVRKTAASSSNISYAGFRTGTELHQLIAGAAFTICPSECHDNCPLSVVESEALRTPVIGSRLGGIPDLIEDGVTGILFEGCSKQGLKDAVSLLWNHEELRLQMAENCKQISVSMVDQYALEVVKLYQRISR